MSCFLVFHVPRVVDCYSHCGILYFSMVCCAILCVHSSLAFLDGEDRAGCIALFVFLVSHDCCVALLCDTMGLSAVCDCVFS